MMNTQTLKARIITQLDVLPVESLELLAEFTTFLRTKSGNDSQMALSENQENLAEIALDRSFSRDKRPIRIMSPRLVNRQEIADFKLEVTGIDDEQL